MTSERLPDGGTGIDRSRPVAFTFGGLALTGFAGDTLASALLANGVAEVGRSIYHDRPRGVVSAGPEEPNALVQVHWPNGVEEPMVNAATLPLEDGLAAWPLTGMGRLATPADSTRFDARHAHVEVLVIGAGASGRAAAAEARRADPGARVLLVDADPAATGDDVLADTTVTGVYDHGYAVAVQRRPVHGTEGRLWRIRAGRIVLATGATERLIAFAGNDRPGIMLAAAAATYVRRYGIRPGRRAVVFTTNDTTRDVEAALREAGTEIAAIVDARRGEAVVGTDEDGDGRLVAVRMADGHRHDADLLVVSGGWNPNVALWAQPRGSLRYDERIAAFVPDAAPVTTPMTAVGAAAGGIDALGEIVPVWTTSESDEDDAGAYVDPGRDSTVADVRRALGAGLGSIEHVKRYTTIGTGIEQGRIGGVVASAVAAGLLGQDVGAVGVPTYRPPLVPIRFAQVAGRDRGPLLADPIRTTAMHRWHVARGAVFEDVGQWKRPRYFPIDPDERMDDAVWREGAATRASVGVMDASTLGKIDVQGPDAGIFLDRIYTNAFSSLKVGSCRYGLMCRPDGMVFDDGVTSRLADDRFHMTTTTGNAAAVLDHLEEWLQTEWPELRVRCTSVTEQWSTIAVVGPRSRDVVAMVVPDLDVSNAAFPFMTWRDAVIAGVLGRVFRISFSGELAYELNVATPHGPTVWEAVMAAGHAHGITPYGTETMHVLRAEKGYPIIGQETDGTVTPQDLGMAALCSTKKSWIGQRSHRRADALRPDRKQLVGLLPVDPHALLPEGAQLVARDANLVTRPVPMLGHVTSSYRSAALGRTFALALVRGGRERIGERLRAPLLDGSVIEAEVTSSVLFDPDNRRRDGEPTETGEASA